MDLRSEDVDLLCGYVLRLGRYAEGFLEKADFGLAPVELRRHIEDTHRHIRWLAGEPPSAVSLRPPGSGFVPAGEEPPGLWNYPQTLRFAAGAAMISQRYRHLMTPDNLRRSVAAKILYKCQTGVLDDLVDKGDYSYIEAKDLYHHVLSGMTSPDFELNAFRTKLASLMRQEQMELFDQVTTLTAAFNRLYSTSPNGQTLFYRMETLDERVALGQALTMFQKGRHGDLPKVRAMVEGFVAPAADVRWGERFAAYVSGGTRYNLIDLSFADRLPDEEEMEQLMTAWYYLDAAIVLLNNVVSVHQDLQRGIVNLSLIAMREEEVVDHVDRPNFAPRLTADDYRAHLQRIADLVGRGLEHAGATQDDGDKYYPFIAVMMPVIMMAELIGRQEELMEVYMEAIRPHVRRAARRCEERRLEPTARALQLAPIAREDVRRAAQQ